MPFIAVDVCWGKLSAKRAFGEQVGILRSMILERGRDCVCCIITGHSVQTAPVDGVRVVPSYTHVPGCGSVPEDNRKVLNHCSQAQRSVVGLIRHT